jgi:hypothetical protein
MYRWETEVNCIRSETLESSCFAVIDDQLLNCDRNNTLVVLALLVGWTPKVTALQAIRPLPCDRVYVLRTHLT